MNKDWTKIYFVGGLSEYKVYNTKAGLKQAVARLKKQYPNAVNVLDVLKDEPEHLERFLKYNPWLQGDAVELVIPYKDGYAELRTLEVK